MKNHACSKIWIVVIIIILVGGGILTWQFWPKEVETPAPATELPEEIRMPEKVEDVIKDEIADWKTYRNEEFGFEIKHPEELKVRWHIINNETTNGCAIGERVVFSFYTISLDFFMGSLTSADYQNLEVSTKDGSYCDFFSSDFSWWEKIVLDTPFQLFSTSLIVMKPVQSISCGISQTAEFSVGKYYNEKYNTFELRSSHYDFPLLSAEDWKTECPKIFQENIQKLEPKIRQFDLVAKSLKFLEEL